MTEHKFTDKEVIKALECHADLDVPCYGRCKYANEMRCGSKMAKDAISLINRQKAEIKKAKNTAEKWKDNLKAVLEERSETKQEVAREIFAEINAIKQEYANGDIHGDEMYVRLYMLEKKYTEGE